MWIDFNNKNPRMFGSISYILSTRALLYSIRRSNVSTFQMWNPLVWTHLLINASSDLLHIFYWLWWAQESHHYWFRYLRSNWKTSKQYLENWNFEVWHILCVAVFYISPNPIVCGVGGRIYHSGVHFVHVLRSL